MSGSAPKSARRSAFPSRRKWPGRGEWKPFLSGSRKRNRRSRAAGPPCTRPKASPSARAESQPMAATALARYRITFGKTEAMRFTGHLDLHRTWERTFRRAGLPLAYSEGFNPHPKINIGAALPLGCLSRGDLIDVWLERELEPAEVEAALRGAAPPGIEIEAVTRLETTEPVLQGRIEASGLQG